jgi:hypothetical protein
VIDDFSGEIEAMKTGDYTVTRWESTTLVNGRVTGQVTTDLPPMPGMVHPTDGSEVRRLPEGLRGREVKVIFTAAALRGMEEAAVPDMISIDGFPFQVWKCERWKELGNFFRSVLVRAGQ